MSIILDTEKARQAAELLNRCYAAHGIFGNSGMPENLTPLGVITGSAQHAMFITMTVSIDYQRDAISLWDSSRKTFEDLQTRYLFHPQALYETPVNKIITDLNKYTLSKKHTQDASIWRRVGTTFYKNWDGNPFNLLKYFNYDAIKVLDMMKKSTHTDNGKKAWDYPFLRGDKIGPLWLKMLRDNVRIEEFKNLDSVPIPVDIHIARSTLALGIVKGKFEGRLEELFDYIRKAWSEGVKGLYIDGKPMIALDLDEPLWYLSKYGCTNRNKTHRGCPSFQVCDLKKLCV